MSASPTAMETKMTESCTDDRGDTWDIYKDNAGEWRWRRTAQNGKIVGASSEGYANKMDCQANARRHGMSCSPT